MAVRLVLLLIGLIVALYGSYRLMNARNFQLFGHLVHHGATDRPVVALTFDDGPSEAHAANVLGMLEAQDVTGTFFLTGQAMETYPEGTAAIAAAGHEIGNHSRTHRRMVLMTPGTVREELESTDTAIRASGYTGPIHFRPPYGKKLAVLPWVLSRQERTTVMWSVEADARADETPEAFAARVVAQTGPGDIVLMHLMFDSRATDRAALPLIIEGLRAKGLGFVTVSDLIAAAD